MPEEKGIELVNDRYWLKRAAEILGESAHKLDEGAKSIAAAMAWFWTVYSAAATAALAFAPQRIDWQWALLIALPAVAIFAAYAVATWAALPVPISFNVVAPSEIKLAHEEAIGTKRRRLKLSFGLAGAATAMVAVVLIAFALNGPRGVDKVAFAVAAGNSGAEIVVGGSLPADAEVLVRVIPAGGAAINRVVTAGKDRAFSISIPVPPAPTYDVQAAWSASARVMTVRQEVKKP